RQWPAEKYAQVATYILQQKKLRIAICGSRQDKSLGTAIMAKISDENITDLTGETNLIELTHLLSAAKLLIANDTSAVHLAVAADTEHILAISSGNHFGRFLPYPKSVSSKIATIFPNEIAKSIDMKSTLGKFYSFNHLDISSIPVSLVIA